MSAAVICLHVNITTQTSHRPHLSGELLTFLHKPFLSVSSVSGVSIHQVACAHHIRIINIFSPPPPPLPSSFYPFQFWIQNVNGISPSLCSCCQPLSLRSPLPQTWTVKASRPVHTSLPSLPLLTPHLASIFRSWKSHGLFLA